MNSTRAADASTHAVLPVSGCIPAPFVCDKPCHADQPPCPAPVAATLPEPMLSPTGARGRMAFGPRRPDGIRATRAGWRSGHAGRANAGLAGTMRAVQVTSFDHVVLRVRSADR